MFYCLQLKLANFCENACAQELTGLGGPEVNPGPRTNTDLALVVQS